MNEFIEQFLIETRELIEAAARDLLALEEAPADSERLDSLLRAFHTLKGAAGIVEFAAMGRALHAAESALVDARGDGPRLTDRLVDDCLACLDQIGRWAETIEATGDLPPQSDAAADALIARFVRDDEQPVARRDDEVQPDWSDEILADHPALSTKARTAFRFVPAADAFFAGQDPLGVIERLPGLLSLDAAAAGGWPALDDFSPFSCYLTFTGLTSASVDEVRSVFQIGAGQLDLKAVERAASNLPPLAGEVIEAQISLLGETEPDGLAGRLAAAGRVAVNVLTWSGLDALANEVRAVSAQSELLGDARALAAKLTSIVSDEGRSAESQREAALPERPDFAARALRIDVGRIDALVKLSGELAVVKNAIGHTAGLAAAGAEPRAIAMKLKDQHALLERLVGELHRAVVNTRVIPLRTVFQRFPRLIREIGAELGKPARLVIQGDATEVDKTIADGLFEPLLHVIRNALDHGIETPDRRSLSGKDLTGSVHLHAERQGGHVVVEVGDDGGGIDLDRVREVAVANGLADAQTLGLMSEADTLNLIFASGFSTTTHLTSLSGRGVGMDAVRSAIMRLGGRVEIESRRGAGTLIRFFLPFSVLMSQVLVIEAGGQAFGIPFDSVVETMRLPLNRIMTVGAAQAFVLRDRTLPLCDLAQLLEQDGRPHDGEALVVVASAAGEQIGLKVDRLGERLEVMLKPMEGLLAETPGVAGTGLLGDGRVLIVLDLLELLR